MAIDAGTVYYTVDAKTQKAIDSAVEMNKSLESMQTTMAKTDQQIRKYTKTLNEAGSSISKAGVVLDEFGNVNTEATAKMQKLMAQMDALNSKSFTMSKTATGVKSSLSGVGRGAGQAGIQLQQFIGQVQGGQSAMLALSQQSADLGFVLGAPLLGAIVGIGASLAGMLLPNLFKTEDALEAVEGATERVRAAITLSSDGITGYSDKMKALAMVSGRLARIKLANLIAEQNSAMKVAADGIRTEVNDLWDDIYGIFGGGLDSVFGASTLSGLSAFQQLQAAADSISLEGINEENINKLSIALEAMEKAGANTTESGKKIISTVTDLVAQYKMGEKAVKDLKEQLDKAVPSFDDNSKSIDKWSDAADRLKVGTEQLRSKQLELEKAITLKKATEDGANQVTLDSIASSYDKRIANAKETESEKALAQAKRDKANAEKEAKKASKDFIKTFGIEDENFKESNPDSEATEFSRTITSTYDGESLTEKLERERGIIKMYQELDIGDAQAHAEAIKEIDKQIADEKKKALDEQVKNQQAATQAQLGIYNQLFSGMQSMTANVLSVMDKQSSGYKTLFAIQKAFAVAQAIVSAELAAAQVLAHDAGIMGMGAVATSNMIRTMGYASAGVIAGTAIAGGRLYGGSVKENGMYRINENGAPEVFNAANGQQYMLPNTRGEVVSNKDASGGGGITTINVTVNTDGSVETNGGASMQKLGKEIGQFVESKFRQLEARSMRQGGALWQYKQKK